jgi:hypothetical protein
VLGTAFGPKLKQQSTRRQEADVTIAQRGETVAVVVASVLRVADANPRCVEQG